MIIDDFKAYLDQIGKEYEPLESPDEVNTLFFSINNLNYIFDSGGKDDPFFFRIILPDIDKVTDNRDIIYQSINAISSRKKVVKAYIYDDSVWLSADIFTFNDDNLNEVFERMIECLAKAQDAYKHFKKTYSDESK